MIGLHEGEGDEAEEGGIELIKAYDDAFVFLAASEKALDDVALAVGLDVVAVLDGLGLTRQHVNPLWWNHRFGAFLTDQTSDASGVVTPIAHDFADVLPGPIGADVKKAPFVLPLGWKKLEIQDAVETDGHVYGRS